MVPSLPDRLLTVSLVASLWQPTCGWLSLAGSLGGHSASLHWVPLLYTLSFDSSHWDTPRIELGGGKIDQFEEGAHREGGHFSVPLWGSLLTQLPAFSG